MPFLSDFINQAPTYRRGLLSNLSGFVQDPQSRQDVQQGLTDAANRGLIAQTFGAPVDMATTLTNLLRAGYGYAGNKLGFLSASQMPGLLEPSQQVGSSEWIGNQLAKGGFVSQNRNPVAETLAGLLAPAAYKGAVKAGGLLYNAESNALANAAKPSTFNAATNGQGGAVVWHGSPHKFDKFDSSKIGTGEGAQAYGHGLYLAESPGVARDYAGALSAAKATKPVGNVDLTQAYQNLPNDVPETLLAARRDFRELTDAGKLSTADRRDFLTAVKNNLAASKNGQLYKVDLPDDAIAKMLNWDKPLSEQPQEIQSIAKSLLGKNNNPMAWLVNDGAAQDMTMTGKQFLNTLIGGESQLQKAGIPGIRYLDGGSRGTGAGTSNFVVFPGNEDMLSILERNGRPVKP